MNLRWMPRPRFVLGVEYLVIEDQLVIPLRCGLFYDPAPSEGHPDTYYGFTLGSGLTKGAFVVDIAYQYRYGQ